jgi:hypothetical protein
VAEANRKKQGDLGASEAQEKMDAIQEKGYFGRVPDPTPNEHYTVGGVIKGKPTPETDKEQYAKARDAVGHDPFPGSS